jgi:hypothetical protein
MAICLIPNFLQRDTVDARSGMEGRGAVRALKDVARNYNSYKLPRR